jgi:toxin ParE1/3/4
LIPVALSRAADADLDAILDYSIGAHGRETAETYLLAIHAAFDRLSDYPELGPEHPGLRPRLRSFPVGEHRVYYRFDRQTLLVVRVLHKAMDAARWLS